LASLAIAAVKIDAEGFDRFIDPDIPRGLDLIARKDDHILFWLITPHRHCLYPALDKRA
jgi:hypothetical protein